MAHDVYAYGMVSKSTLYKLDGKFPGPDGYCEFAEALPMIGGEAANSSLVLARLGVSVRLDGNWLGTLNGGEGPLALLRERGIDASRLLLRPGYRGVEEVVFAGADARTIFGTYVKLFAGGPQWSAPQEEDVAGARVVSLDAFFRAESLAAARLARAHRKPYVTIDCKYDDEIAVHADVNVVSGEFRHNAYADRELEELFARYRETARGLVVFTHGGGEVLYARAGGPVRRMPAYRIEPVDTAGAGDAFRAGMVYAVLRGWPDDTAVQFSAALAAHVCGTFPGVLKSPTLAELGAWALAQGRPLPEI